MGECNCATRMEGTSHGLQQTQGETQGPHQNAGSLLGDPWSGKEGAGTHEEIRSWSACCLCWATLRLLHISATWYTPVFVWWITSSERVCKGCHGFWQRLPAVTG